MNKWELENNDLVRRRMGKTGEEISELGAVCSRVDIQGLDAIDPNTQKTNRQRLAEEIADVYAQLDENIECLGLDLSEINERRAEKRRQMAEWESLYK